MEKHKKILEYAISSLLRRKYRHLSIIAVFSLIVSVLASILFLTHSLKTEAMNVLQEAPEVVLQKTMGGRHDLIPLEYAGKVKEILGVGKVIPRYWGYYYDSMSGSNFTVMGVDENIRGLKMMKGRMPSKHDECTIGKGVAGIKGTDVGGKIYLLDSKGNVKKFYVSGVFSSESEMLTNDLLLFTKKETVNFLGMPSDRATDIVVEINNDFEVPYIIHKIKEIMPDTRPIMKVEIIRTYDTVFSWRSGIVLALFSGALLAFCILAWDKATGLSAEEKQEIGILKAIGWEVSDVLELKFWEGLVISLTSFLTGVILAYVHVYFFNASVFAPLLKGWSVLFPQFRLVPYLDPYHMFVLLFLTVVPYVASTIIPSWKASITDPDIVMRG